MSLYTRSHKLLVNFMPNFRQPFPILAFAFCPVDLNIPSVYHAIGNFYWTLFQPSVLCKVTVFIRRLCCSLKFQPFLCPFYHSRCTFYTFTCIRNNLLQLLTVPTRPLRLAMTSARFIRPVTGMLNYFCINFYFNNHRTP